MSAGITRAHGAAVLPSQRPSTIQFYSVLIPSQNIVSESTVTNGAFDQMFRIAVDQFATVAFIGTPTFFGNNTVLNFAIETTGVDALSPTGLGQGSSENTSWTSGAAFGATTQAALQNAIQSLGTAVGPNSINLSTSTVSFGVVGTTGTAYSSSVYGF